MIIIMLHMLLIFKDSVCPLEQDDTWNITWLATKSGEEAEQHCPGIGR